MLSIKIFYNLNFQYILIIYIDINFTVEVFERYMTGLLSCILSPHLKVHDGFYKLVLFHYFLSLNLHYYYRKNRNITRYKTSNCKFIIAKIKANYLQQENNYAEIIIEINKNENKNGDSSHEGKSH